MSIVPRIESMNRIVPLLSLLLFVLCKRILTETLATTYNSLNNPTSRCLCEYDNNGHIVMRLDYVLKDDLFVEDTKVIYSTNQMEGIEDSIRVHYKKIENEWKPVSKVVDSYNEKHLIISSNGYEYKDADWNETYFVKWTYDSLDRITSQISNSWRNIYEYGDGYVLCSSFVSDNGELRVEIDYTHYLDAKGNEIKYSARSRTTDGWKDLFIVYKTYDKQNIIQEESVIYADNYVNPDSTKTVYSYDLSGRVIGKSSFYANEGDWDTDNMMEWEYDESCRISKAVLSRFGNGLLQDKVINEYEYDKEGNRIFETTKRWKRAIDSTYLDHMIVIENHYK